MNEQTIRYRLLCALCELDEGPDCDPTGMWQFRARAEVQAALHLLDNANREVIGTLTKHYGHRRLVPDPEPRDDA